MLRDKNLELGNAQALSADSAFTFILDMESVTPARQVGTGEPLCLVLQIGVAADHTSGDETYKFIIQQSDNDDLSSPDDIISRTLAYSVLTAGSLHYIPLPPGTPTKRYLGGYFDGGGTTPTVTATAFLQPLSMIESRQVYPVGSVML